MHPAAQSEQPQADMEAALRDSEARLRAILDSASDAIVVTDVAGTILSVNPAAERMFGYRASEIVGVSLRKLITDPFRGVREADLRALMEGGAETVVEATRETTGRRRGGSVFPIEVVLSAFHDGTPKFTSIIRDVTVRRNLQRALATSVAEEQESMARELHDGVAQQLAGVEMLAHALHAQLESAESVGTETAARLLGEVHRALDQLRAFIKGMYQKSVEAGGLEAALCDLVIETREWADLQCTLSTPGKPVTPDATVATQLFNIAREAVNNALRHAQALHIQITLAVREHVLLLNVQDDGRGIEPGHIGSGLGTQIMEYRAALLGAQLDIDRVDSGGTLVTCALPLEVVHSEG